MKKNMIKISSLILCLIMLLGIFPLTVFAGEQEYVPFEWTMDENARYIYGNDKRYDRFYVNYTFFNDSLGDYYFMNPVAYGGKDCQVYGDSADPHIVSVKKGDGYSFVFVDTQGKKILNDFLTRKDCTYYLESYAQNKLTTINKSFVSNLENLYNSNSGWLTQVSVASLGEAEILEIVVRDKTNSKAYQHGAIYIMGNNTYYYVCFEKLGNSYFDADGYFSYRSGTVKALRLNSDLCEDVDLTKGKLANKRVRRIYESNVVSGITDTNGDPLENNFFSGPEARKGAIIVFSILFVFLGLMLPVPFLILGLIFGRKSKCWHGLTVSSGVWFISALLLLIIMVL